MKVDMEQYNSSNAAALLDNLYVAAYHAVMRALFCELSDVRVISFEQYANYKQVYQRMKMDGALGDKQNYTLLHYEVSHYDPREFGGYDHLVSLFSEDIQYQLDKISVVVRRVVDTGEPITVGERKVLYGCLSIIFDMYRLK